MIFELYHNNRPPVLHTLDQSAKYDVYSNFAFAEIVLAKVSEFDLSWPQIN